MRTDTLTGFFLREHLEPFLQEQFLTTKIANTTFTIALIDLDRFKRFNDRYGHQFGDEVLKYFSGTIKLTLRDTIFFIFRYGGDEFIVVFPEKTPKEVHSILTKFRHNLRYRPFLAQNRLYHIRMSCGIAAGMHDAKTPAELIKKADEAMYYAKRHGRNSITHADQIFCLRLVNFIAAIISGTFIVLSILIASNIFSVNIESTLTYIVNKIQSVGKTPIKKNPLSHKNSPTARQETCDIVILKNGGIFEGKIITETQEKIIFNLYMANGEGMATFYKKEIEQIKHDQPRISGSP
ncbi:MAG: GGDEF domain-containing protein [Candidatus Omnitrophica bacterium]|nr:GGDEF domain-containing protein [Candidatus Omnitrophota bacterium]